MTECPRGRLRSLPQSHEANLNVRLKINTMGQLCRAKVPGIRRYLAGGVPLYTSSSGRMRTAAPSRSSCWPLFSDHRNATSPARRRSHSAMPRNRTEASKSAPDALCHSRSSRGPTMKLFGSNSHQPSVNHPDVRRIVLAAAQGLRCGAGWVGHRGNDPLRSDSGVSHIDSWAIACGLYGRWRGLNGPRPPGDQPHAGR